MLLITHNKRGILCLKSSSYHWLRASESNREVPGDSHPYLWALRCETMKLSWCRLPLVLLLRSSLPLQRQRDTDRIVIHHAQKMMAEHVFFFREDAPSSHTEGGVSITLSGLHVCRLKITDGQQYMYIHFPPICIPPPRLLIQFLLIPPESVTFH